MYIHVTTNAIVWLMGFIPHTPAPDDYTRLVSSPFVFSAGSQPGDTVPVNVTIVNDNLVEPEETFILEVSSPDTEAVAVLDTAVGAITDTDRKFHMALRYTIEGFNV